ncbi:hypothetical protein Osc7112_2667 [Oscillatoria nigro-viridis PCC 7112]|uniref:Uncharacterized protein n=1 Tax=Phormidium nigroviride PCC 7112 TaxID=179408 RepID=K9VGM1_9CYAN|nr:hypothetical protein [Oscillatoria nigro-viridis]AFZ07081.1 hypothetical protein Osc7112_2667 [Oscillatoria nigro-viridis PCC 7112]
MAATIGGTIKVNVSKGDFAGVYTGDFAYDDTHLTKVGTEHMTINGGNGDLAGLLSFNFKFLNFADGLTPVTYTASDVDGFPDAPVLAFENGIPTQFGLQIFSASGKDGLMFGDPKAFNFALRNGTIGGDGVVTLETTNEPSPEPTPVPENSSPFSSLLAFLGLGGVHLWRKSRKG